MPWAPALHDTGEQCLFRIICNIWAKPVDDLSEMTIFGKRMTSGIVMKGLRDLRILASNECRS